MSESWWNGVTVEWLLLTACRAHHLDSGVLRADIQVTGRPVHFDKSANFGVVVGHEGENSTSKCFANLILFRWFQSEMP